MSYKVQCALDECTDEELKKDYNEKTNFVDSNNDHHCVTFVQSIVPIPKTTLWKRGTVQVKYAEPGAIPKGTVIATFDENGKYPTDKLGKHAAIYLRHNNDYIEVYDQWVGQDKVLKRQIRFNRSTTTKRSNNGDTFWVVEVDK